MEARSLLLVLLEVLEMEGWTLYASVDQCKGPVNENDTVSSSISLTKSWFQLDLVDH